MKIREDLKKHFWITFTITTLLFIALFEFYSIPIALFYAFILSNLAMFIFKEVVWDLIFKKGHFDWTDLIGNLCGSFYFMACGFILYYLLVLLSKVK